MSNQDSQKKLEEKLGGDTPPVVLSNEVVKSVETAEKRFNKKVDVKTKLKVLGAAIGLTVAPVVTNAETIHNEAATISTEQTSEQGVRDYSYYEEKALSDDLEYKKQLQKSFELYHQMEKGEMGYIEAKSASEHILAYPEGVYDFYQAAKKAKAEDAELGMMKSKNGYGVAGHPQLTEGKDFKFAGDLSPREVVPLTEEYAKRLEVVENNSVKSTTIKVERGVTTGVLTSISNDATLTEEAKNSLIREEVKDFFASIDSGRYDTAEDSSAIKNRNNWKRDTLKDLSRINPTLSEELHKQYSLVDVTKIINSNSAEM